MRTVSVKMRAVKTMEGMEVVTIYFMPNNRMDKPLFKPMEVMEVFYRTFTKLKKIYKSM